MHISWRLGFRMFLILTAAALVWVRIVSLRHSHKPPTNPIRDLSVTNPLNRPGGGPPPMEAYEVYSGLYRSPMNEALAFGEDSQTDIPQVGQGCLAPSTPEEHELADAFVAANQQSHRWEPRFSIPQGYRLLKHNETAQALTCLSGHMRDAAQCTSYKQFRSIRLLGVPGFNRSHTRGLVSVIKSCGNFCGSGGILEVEKQAGTWRRSELTDFTHNCSWMY
ncbi:MAG TPA: hypothetical protein VGM27_26725 [Acidobacteriaceae bacterium]